MVQFLRPPRITSFLIKIASRCNLACDYCYVYEHADQSWRAQPPFMADRTRRRLADRVGEYARAESLDRLVVVFHGGEPLLGSPERIAETARWINASVPDTTRVDFSLQTNGTLLDEDAIRCLAAEGLTISLSIDGPRRANDLHRLDHSGKSSFNNTLGALELLEKHTETYGGLISVIDPAISPEELFAFFAPRLPPRLDFLLPDANYQRLPPGRSANRDLYKNWLVRAFDLWFDQYPHLPVRIFDAVLNGVVGIPSDTDAFGFGDVSLLTIETDGSYHDLDVLKITAEGATALGLNLESHSISDAANSSQISAHRLLLCKEGLSKKCQTCPEVEVCGGGAVPHRFSSDGFANPTIYCEEMLALVSHARRRMREALHEESVGAQPHVTHHCTAPIDLAAWERPERSTANIQTLLENWTAQVRPKFEKVLGHIFRQYERLRPAVEGLREASPEALSRLVVQPAVYLWTNVMASRICDVVVRSIDGEPIPSDPDYVVVLNERLRQSPEQYPRIQRDDPWLRLPFGRRIHFEDEASASEAEKLVYRSFEIIEAWRPALMDEIRTLDPDIQFIHDPDAHPDKAVSFSDNSTPGALYIGIRVRGGFIDPYLLADSIIHEHRHQKLYLLQQEISLVEVDSPTVASPWREDPRPPSGLFHAVFVFVHLHEYWQHLAFNGPSPVVRARARGELSVIRHHIEAALPTLRGTRLTKRGAELVDCLDQVFRAKPCAASQRG
jgi:uncharacterized protein